MLGSWRLEDDLTDPGLLIGPPTTPNKTTVNRSTSNEPWNKANKLDFCFSGSKRSVRTLELGSEMHTWVLILFDGAYRPHGHWQWTLQGVCMHAQGWKRPDVMMSLRWHAMRRPMGGWVSGFRLQYSSVWFSTVSSTPHADSKHILHTRSDSIHDPEWKL